MVRFTTKKIDSMTLGERMRSVRNERRLTLSEISRNTNVQIKHLECLEEGLYSKLPAEVYVKGFIRNYANYMGFDPEPLLRQYEKERKIERNIRKEDVDEDKKIEPLGSSGFVITPKTIVITVGIIVVFSGVVYLYRQVNNFVSNPRLVIMRPADGESINNNSVSVAGVAEKDARVTINGQSIVVNENGEFSQEISLAEGLNVVTVIAKNKFEKENTQIVSVNAIYESLSGQAQETAEENVDVAKKILLELKVVLKPIQITVEADGSLMYNGVLESDIFQKFEANEEITVTSGDGSNTIIKLNGKEEEKLSDKKGAARDIVFTPDGRVEQKK